MSLFIEIIERQSQRAPQLRRPARPRSHIRLGRCGQRAPDTGVAFQAHPKTAVTQTSPRSALPPAVARRKGPFPAAAPGSRPRRPPRRAASTSTASLLACNLARKRSRSVRSKVSKHSTASPLWRFPPRSQVRTGEQATPSPMTLDAVALAQHPTRTTSTGSDRESGRKATTTLRLSEDCESAALQTGTIPGGRSRRSQSNC
jgi:hypothetical protein